MEVSSTRSSIRRWSEQLKNREDQLTVVLSLVIGVLVGLMVVAFILLTGRLAAQMYPAGGSAWRRVVIPIIGARKLSQFQDNLASLELTLSSDQLKTLDEASRIEPGFPQDLYEREMVRAIRYGGLRDQILA